MAITIITGASSGLGSEFARVLIGEAKKNEEVWLLARRKDRLDELAKEFPDKTVRTFCVDLRSAESVADFEKVLKKEKPVIGLLVNNAGTLTYGTFEEVDLEKAFDMVETNIKGTLRMTKICLPYIPKKGRIIVTDSASAFSPLPNLSVYSSTKAFLKHFFIGLKAELKKKKIKITLLCPGNMPTEMVLLSDHKDDLIYAAGGMKLPWHDLNTVVKETLKANEKNKMFITPHPLFYKAYRQVCAIVPNTWMTATYSPKK